MFIRMCTSISLILSLGMAENNATWRRKNVLHRETQFAASAIYKGIVQYVCIKAEKKLEKIELGK